MLYNAHTTMDTILDQVTEGIRQLSFHRLDQDWVNTMWDDEFRLIGDIPLDYESFLSEIHPLHTLSDLQTALSSWITASRTKSTSSETIQQEQSSRSAVENEPDRRIWTVPMMQSNGSWKSLLSVLALFIQKGKKMTPTQSEINISIQAAILYCTLISVHGSEAFLVFHPVLYQKAISLLQLSSKITSSRSKSKSLASQQTQKAARGHPPRHEVDSGEEDDDDNIDIVPMSNNEIRHIINKLNELLNAVALVARHFSFASQQESLEQTVKQLCSVVSGETSRDVTFSLDVSAFKGLASNAYPCLLLLCRGPRVSLDDCIGHVFKNLLPMIFGNHKDAGKLAPRECLALRDHIIAFVNFFVKIMGKPAHLQVYRLIQHLCAEVPDRAEYRQRGSQSVVKIMRELPPDVYHRVINWLLLLAHHEQARFRLVALEVVSRLLHEDEKEMEIDREDPVPVDDIPRMETINEPRDGCIPDEEVPGDSRDRAPPVAPSSPSQNESTDRDQQVSKPPEARDDRVDAVSGRCLVALLYSSSHDVSAQVRAKAMASLADCGKTEMEAIRAVFLEILSTASDSSTEEPVDIVEALKAGKLNGPKLLPSAAALLNLVRKRALDERVVVRKSALTLLASMMTLDDKFLTKDVLQVLVDRGRDSALLLRRFAMELMTDLVLEHPQHVLLCEKWVETVIPQAFDPEVKVVEAVSNLAKLVIVDNIAHNQMSVMQSNLLAWRVLSVIVGKGYERFLSSVCELWIKDKIVNKQLMWALRSYVHSSNDESVWSFMALIAHHVPLEDCQFAIEYFKQSLDSDNQASRYALQKLLSVLTSSIKAMKREISQAFTEYLQARFSSFRVPVTLIGPTCEYLVAYYHITAALDAKKAALDIATWADPLIKACEMYLSGVVFKGPPGEGDAFQDKLLRHLITLGCCALQRPNQITKRIFVMLQQIVFAPTMNTREEELPLTQPESQTLHHNTVLPAVVQAAAVATLGKTCLQHEEVAERVIAAFGRLLDTTTSVAVRNNVVVVLCDMVQRYATKVDPVLPQMTACLKDPDVMVRRNLLTYMVDLLQEDYLKLKGTFFFRILQMVVDEDEVVSNLAQFYLTERLLKKQANVLQFHFVECFFHFNSYENHGTYNKFVLSEREKRLFTIHGTKNAHLRLRLYYFMLKNMDDVQRFTVAFKLCTDVLGGVAHGVIPLSTPQATNLLQDALTVLASEDIKMSSLKTRNEDDPADIEDMACAILTTTKKTLLSSVVRKNTIENTVPIIVLLKHKLEELKSPLLGSFMDYLKEVMKDFKNEVKEVLAVDKQLATEIEYDLKRYEQEKRDKQDQLRQTTIATPVIATPRAVNNQISVPETAALPPLVQQILQRAQRASLARQSLLSPQLHQSRRSRLADLPDLESSAIRPEQQPPGPESLGENAPKAVQEELRTSTARQLMSTPLRPRENQIDFDATADLSAIPLLSVTNRIQLLPADEASPSPRVLVHLQRPEEWSQPSTPQRRRSSRRLRRPDQECPPK